LRQGGGTFDDCTVRGKLQARQQTPLNDWEIVEDNGARGGKARKHSRRQSGFLNWEGGDKREKRGRLVLTEMDNGRKKWGRKKGSQQKYLPEVATAGVGRRAAQGPVGEKKRNMGPVCAAGREKKWEKPLHTQRQKKFKQSKRREDNSPLKQEPQVHEKSNTTPDKLRAKSPEMERKCRQNVGHHREGERN